MAGGQEQKDIEKPMTSIGNNQQDHRTDLEEEWLLRRRKKRYFTVVFIVPKTFMKLSVHNKAELILNGGLKKEQFFAVQQKDITKLAEVNFWPTNTSQAAMFLRPTKLNFRLKQFGFQPVNATQIHLDNSTSLDQIKDLISISKGCHQFI